jgi:hypothetical protein
VTGGDIDIPSLPVAAAADQILKADPILGAVVIFQTAAICFLIWWLLRVYHEKDEALVVKDRELSDSRAAHIADLKLNIPAMQELRETILSLLPRGRR